MTRADKGNAGPGYRTGACPTAWMRLTDLERELDCRCLGRLCAPSLGDSPQCRRDKSNQRATS